MSTSVSDFVRQLLDRNEPYLLGALEGIDPDMLHRQPGPESNSIAWLVWHLSRVQDNHVSAMAGRDHVWITGGWVERMGLGLDPMDRGRGHTPEQIAAFRVPSVSALMDYYEAVRDATGTFLDEMDDAALERQVPAVSGDGTVPLAQRLEMTLADGLQHTGQVAYLRGLFEGRGWLAV